MSRDSPWGFVVSIVISCTLHQTMVFQRSDQLVDRSISLDIYILICIHRIIHKTPTTAWLRKPASPTLTLNLTTWKILPLPTRKPDVLHRCLYHSPLSANRIHIFGTLSAPIFTLRWPVRGGTTKPQPRRNIRRTRERHTHHVHTLRLVM